MGKTIVTVLGQDTVGIIAKVCTYLSDNNINIEDISQTIIQGYFNMMMIVDTSKTEKPFADMVKDNPCTDNKELLIIPDAVHTDLYDRKDIIPFDKIEAFFRQYLK